MNLGDQPFANLSDFSSKQSASGCEYSYAFNWAIAPPNRAVSNKLEVSSSSGTDMEQMLSAQQPEVSNIYGDFRTSYYFWRCMVAGTYRVKLNSAYYGCLTSGSSFWVRLMKLPAAGNISNADASATIVNTYTITSSGGSSGTSTEQTYEVELAVDDKLYFKLFSDDVNYILFQPSAVITKIN